MPSHIYIRTGEYHLGTLANIKAIQVDSTYVSACNAQGVYPLSYFPHNQHFMAATATLEGNSSWAIYAAKEVSENSNRQLMKEPDWGTIQHYYTIPYYVYVKFGKWDEILSLENNLEELDYPRAILHYARGMAFVGKGNLDSAGEELEKLSELASNESLREVTIWDINTVFDLVQIAERVLRAEISRAEGNYQQGIDLLKEGVAMEDGLNYNEPPDWFFSVRHNLGSLQIQAGRYKDAVETYTEDLERLPKNGWALKGLASAYSKLGDTKSSDRAEEQFLMAWSTADIQLSGSMIK
jgi:tetratricopeptide (TPR) repeat protein